MSFLLRTNIQIYKRKTTETETLTAEKSIKYFRHSTMLKEDPLDSGSYSC